MSEVIKVLRLKFGQSLVVAPAITEGPVSITLESLFKKFHVCRFHTEYHSVMRQVRIPNPSYWSLASQSIKLRFYSTWDEIKKTYKIVNYGFGSEDYSCANSNQNLVGKWHWLYNCFWRKCNLAIFF